MNHGQIERFKTIEVEGTQYRIARFEPEVGSYILGWFLIGGTSSGGDESEPKPEPEQRQPEKKPTGEEVVRAVAMGVIFRGTDFHRQTFALKKCMEVCSRYEGDGESIPMPIMSKDGRWLLPDIKSDLALVLKLQLETLVFNFSSFFEKGGLSELAGPTLKEQE